MAKVKLETLSKEQLEKKKTGLKILIGFFIPIILLLMFFVVRDFLNGQELDWATITIIICSIGGVASVYPEFKEVQKELKTRD